MVWVGEKWGWGERYRLGESIRLYVTFLENQALFDQKHEKWGVECHKGMW
jgi:hypothetical protein